MIYNFLLVKISSGVQALLVICTKGKLCVKVDLVAFFVFSHMHEKDGARTIVQCTRYVKGDKAG